MVSYRLFILALLSLITIEGMPMYWFVYILLPSIICSYRFPFGFNPLLATSNQKWNLCMCVCVERPSDFVEWVRVCDANQVNGWWWFMGESRMRQPLSNAPNTANKKTPETLLLFNCTIRINRSPDNYCRWIKLKVDHRFACANENPTSHVAWTFLLNRETSRWADR